MTLGVQMRVRACPEDMGMVSYLQLTPNMGPPKKFSMKALGESSLLSHKSSSGRGSMTELWLLEENKYNGEL